MRKRFLKFFPESAANSARSIAGSVAENTNPKCLERKERYLVSASDLQSLGPSVP
jgi:hypothetical protein